MATSTEKARSLLSRVLREPFEFFEASDEVFDFHIHEWFKYLIRNLPLWTWQPQDFAYLHSSGLPLQQIIESIRGHLAPTFEPDRSG